MTILTTRQSWRRDPAMEGKQLGNRITLTERENVRRALAYLIGRYTSGAACAKALGITDHALWKGLTPKRAQTYRLACVVARGCGVPVEKILSGLWPGDRCPHCGGTGKRSQIVGRAK